MTTKRAIRLQAIFRILIEHVNIQHQRLKTFLRADVCGAEALTLSFLALVSPPRGAARTHGTRTVFHPSAATGIRG